MEPQNIIQSQESQQKSQQQTQYNDEEQEILVGDIQNTTIQQQQQQPQTQKISLKIKILLFIIFIFAFVQVAYFTAYQYKESQQHIKQHSNEDHKTHLSNIKKQGIDTVDDTKKINIPKPNIKSDDDHKTFLRGDNKETNGTVQTQEKNTTQETQKEEEQSNEEVEVEEDDDNEENTLNQYNNYLLEWGHYKPHLLYSISQKNDTTHNPISINMGYYQSNRKQSLKYQFNDKGPDQNHYDFEENDGINYSFNKITDKSQNILINSLFYKQKANKNHQNWINEHIVEQINEQEDQQTSLVFVFSIETYDLQQEQEIFINMSKSKTKPDTYKLQFFSKKFKKNIGYTYINFETIDPSNNDSYSTPLPKLQHENTSFFQKNLAREHNWNSRQQLNMELSFHNGIQQFKNKEDQSPTLVAIQVTYVHQKSQKLRATLQYHSNKQNFKPLKDLSNLKEKLKENFHLKLQQQINTEFFTLNSQQQKCTKASVSNLMGGMVYKYGNLQFVQQEEQQRQKDKPIFSFSPSRSRFSWSFLWDDGFHNAINCRLNPQLCLDMISSWLDTINEEGWIPREQPRGAEAKGLCSCPDFEAKDNRDGNPPSLLLGISYILNNKQLKNQDYVINFIKNKYQQLKLWHQWYIKKQKHEFQNQQVDFIFKWWDKPKDSDHISMNSGLDDFPRFTNRGSKYITAGHIDCQSWMYFFTDIMHNLSEKLKKSKDTQQFQEMKEEIQKKTDKFYLDPSNNLYSDFFIEKHSKELNINGILHSEHYGYPSLLPLAFGLIQKNSKQLEATLKMIRDPNQLWTDFGLRSLSKKSYHFKKGNNYWTNPIWIHLNYLVLKGLKLHYNDSNEFALETYNMLRNNVINTVCGNYENTGYFYENYNKLNENGQGSDAHPFTGWTAVISLIISEQYE